MNYNAMSDLELLHYLDVYSDDPLIRRLVNVLAKTRGALVDDLVDVGMDAQHWTFGDGWSQQSPGQYIQELRDELRHAEDELELAQRELSDMQDECDRLRARTIMEFVEEVQREKRESQSLVREAMKTVKAFKDENDDLKQKIDMWGAMNRVRA